MDSKVLAHRACIRALEKMFAADNPADIASNLHRLAAEELRKDLRKHKLLDLRGYAVIAAFFAHLSISTTDLASHDREGETGNAHSQLVEPDF